MMAIILAVAVYQAWSLTASFSSSTPPTIASAQKATTERPGSKRTTATQDLKAKSAQADALLQRASSATPGSAPPEAGEALRDDSPHAAYVPSSGLGGPLPATAAEAVPKPASQPAISIRKVNSASPPPARSFDPFGDARTAR